ncbi:YCF48-related protein [Oceaniserpentilla sp. 4NH20-0058]|uniref:WD40/YVTN/BNR-like repeat-containing protein n=1 Tax=Oceaniserpentilla sp. 4NH20-0058 TaxID=3127660 RepID=UPI00310C61CE
MRTLLSVGTALKTAIRFISSSVLVAALGLPAMQATAQWQDPLNVPAIPSLIAHKSLLLDVTVVGDRYVAVGARGHIIFSDDEGRTWTQANVPTTTTLTAVYFASESTGWVVGHDAIVLKTQDGGQTWVKQFDGFIANEMVLEAAKKDLALKEEQFEKVSESGDDDLIYEAESALENATFTLEDAEIDFEDRSTKPLLDLWFKNDKEGFVIGAYGMLFKTVDGGESWETWSSNVENPDRFHLNSIAKIDDQRLIIAGEAGTILTSNNSGNTWEKMESPYDGSFFGVVALTNNVQLAFGLRGNLVRSSDYGQSWEFIDTHTKQTLLGGTDHLGLTAYVVGSGGAFLKGIAAGTKWESKTRSARDNAATIVETKSGEFILVGEGGVKILDNTGALLPVKVKTIEG